MMKRRAFLLVALMALFVGEQSIAETEPRFGPPLLLKGATDSRYAPALDTQIELSFSGPLGRAQIEQRFFNGTGEWVEGIYVFPLPDSASVDDMELTVGNRVIRGEIAERETAQRTYARSKAAGQRAAIVEQERPNLFTTSVANIGPGETVTIRIGFWLTAEYRDAAFSTRLPLTLTPRYLPGVPVGHQGPGFGPDTSEVPDGSRITPPVSLASPAKAAIKVQLTPGIPIAQFSSATHALSVTRLGDDGDGERFELRPSENPTPMDRDLVIDWFPKPSANPAAAFFIERFGDHHYAMVLAVPPDQAQRFERSRELTLVVDTSGSMAGQSIRQAKAALELALSQLAPGDSFNIIEFNSTSRRLFPHSMPASRANVTAGRRFLQSLDAEGGTEMKPALVAAMEPPIGAAMKQIVFVTDGSVGNEHSLVDLVHERIGDARLFSVGLGSAPNGWFMRALAREGRGTATLIPTEEAVAEGMAQLFNKLESPQVTDIAVDWGTAAAQLPNPLPDVYAGESLLAFARVESNPGLVSVSGEGASGYWLRQLTPNVVSTAGIAQAWGRNKVNQLEDRIRRTGDTDELSGESLAIALELGLLTQRTAFVAVEEEIARPDFEPLRQGAVANALPAGTQPSGFVSFPGTATGYPLRLLLALITLVASIGLFAGATFWIRPA